MQYCENTVKIGDDTPIDDLRVLPIDGVPDILNNEPVGNQEDGWFVPIERKGSVRTVMSQIKMFTGKKFKSVKVPFRDGFPLGGINIWRTA
jgi:hypothetical protein